jgi:hypothetical protein
MVVFAIIDKDGRVLSDNSKVDAYKHMAYLQSIGVGYRLTVEDGQYTVAGDGCMALTFTPKEILK